MWKDMSEDERAICLELAKSVWHADNPRSEGDTDDARGEAWKASKKEEMQRAIKITNRLKAAGINMSK